MGSGKYGLTQLQNLAQLPPTGAVLIAAPLPIVVRLRLAVAGAGAGRARMTVADGRVGSGPLVRCGIDAVFGVVGSGNFVVTNAMVAAGARYVAARHEGGAATMADAYARMSGGVGGGQPAPGVRPDQRADRHHRGGEEPHAAGGRGGRGDVSRGRTSSSTSRRWPRRSARCRCGSTRAGDAVGAGRRGGRDRGRDERRVVLLNLPLDVQGRRTPRRRSRPRRRRPAGGSAATTPTASGGWPTRCAPRGGRCSSPAAARGARLPRGARGRWPSAAARCWRPRPSPRGCSAAARGRSTCPAGSPSPLAAELISGADLIVGWGCALNMWTMRHGRLIADDAVVVQVDVEPRRARGAARRRVRGGR